MPKSPCVSPSKESLVASIINNSKNQSELYELSFEEERLLKKLFGRSFFECMMDMRFDLYKTTKEGTATHIKMEDMIDTWFLSNVSILKILQRLEEFQFLYKEQRGQGGKNFYSWNERAFQFFMDLLSIHHERKWEKWKALFRFHENEIDGDLFIHLDFYSSIIERMSDLILFDFSKLKSKKVLNIRKGVFKYIKENQFKFEDY